MDATISQPWGPVQLETHARWLGSNLRCPTDQKADDGPQKVKSPVTQTLRVFRQNVHTIERGFAVAQQWSQEYSNPSPVVDWILDNYWSVREKIRDVERFLPNKFLKELPRVDNGEPRIQIVATELILHSDGLIDEAKIIDFANIVQEGCEFTIGECWAYSTFLKLSLIDRLAALCDNMMEDFQSRQETQNLLDRIQTGSDSPGYRELQLLPSSAIASLWNHCQFLEQCDITVKASIQNALRDRGITSDEVQRIDRQRLASCQVSISNVIASLRLLERIDWTDVFESTNRVHRVLCGDPAAVYDKMDFASQNIYRERLEELAKCSGRSQLEVAAQVVELCNEIRVSDRQTGLTSHVGYWIVDAGRAKLLQALDIETTLPISMRSWFRDQFQAYYGPAITILLAAMTLVLGGLLWSQGVSIGLIAIFCFLALIPLSDVALQIVNTLATRLVPVRILPRLELEEEIPAKHPTMVVVPSMFGRRSDVTNLFMRLESHYLANRDSSTRFALLTDFPDAENETEDGDEALLQLAKETLASLNAKYSSIHGDAPFYWFHRKRLWNAAEAKWMGWERKRGKLDELSKLLLRKGETSYVVKEGDLTKLAVFAEPTKEPFIITLDADTVLPRQSVAKMIGSLAHPLNRPIYSQQSNGYEVHRGYTILQPRISVLMENGARSLYHRLMAFSPGIDPYVSSASDVYQDVFGEASFTGKGIYDLRAFDAVLHQRFPENRILSHDLIEGNFARVGLLSDVELYDSYPQRFDVDMKRQHRWTRGDWQIATWMFPTVPSVQGRVANRFRSLAKWKIFDNLRRSIIPLFTVALVLIASCYAGPTGRLLSLLAMFTVLTPLLLQILTGIADQVRIAQQRITDTRGQWMHLLHTISNSAVIGLFQMAVLPYRAIMFTDAIIRTVWRMHFSKRKLLEWETAATTESRVQSTGRSVAAAMLPAALMGGLVCLLSFAFGSGNGIAWGMLWAASPMIAQYASKVRKEVSSEPSQDDHRFMRAIFSATWAYFEYATNTETLLPPDNLQEVPSERIAHRISPTNQGLYLVAIAVAQRLGLTSRTKMVELLEKNLENWLSLETWNGHHFNWYHCISRTPLTPRYVSTVDSGNLLASYITLLQALREMKDSPMVRVELVDAALAGIDWLRFNLQQCERPSKLSVVTHRDVDEASRQLISVLSDLERDLPNFEASLAWTESFQRWLGSANKSLTQWCSSLSAATKPHFQDVVTSIEILCARFEIVLTELELVVSLTMADQSAANSERFAKISLHLIATGIARGPANDNANIRNVDQLLQRTAKLIAICEEAIAKMDFAPLYSSRKKLFSIGYNVDAGALDRSFYDLLCSECRLTSFLAIAKNSVDTEHWFRLGRQTGETGGKFTLLSWGGTMFEYFMPPLFQRVFPGSLMWQTLKHVVQTQIQYGKRMGTPWGISESAFAKMATNADYQYQSFGVPGLGIKRGLERDLVISPYSTFLALPFANQAAIQNLTQLKSFAFGLFGFYDAIDYTPRRQKPKGKYTVVRNYMAHHHGMSLLALANTLHDNMVQKWFHANPIVRANELLLQERPPAVVTVESLPVVEPPPTAHNKSTGTLVARQIHGHRVDTPRVMFLSNGYAHLQFSHNGGSYFRYKDKAINRWRSDSTLDDWGTFIYLRDLSDASYWSATYQPTRVEPDSYEAIFSIDKGEVRRRQGDIESSLEVTVSPEHNAEVRLLRLVNQGKETKKIEITSYCEVVLADMRSDMAHPAFSKLFIETEFVEEDHAIVAKRRPRDKRESPIFAVHTIAVPIDSVHTLQYESSRETFLGRGRSAQNPMSLDSDRVRLDATQGAVLDPIFSLRVVVELNPGESRSIGFTTAYAESREKAIELADVYQELSGVERAFELAWAYKQVELKQSNLIAEQTHLYQKLGGALLYPDERLRGDPRRIEANQLSQNSLWRFGISGDLPILLVRVASDSQLPLVEETLHALQYLTATGLEMDLVLMNDFPTSYIDELQAKLQRCVDDSGLSDELTKHTYVIRGSALTREDQNLFESAASLVLYGARGSMQAQFNAAVVRSADRTIPFAPSVPCKAISRRRLPCIDGNQIEQLPDGVRFSLKPHQQTPAPWCNVIANPNFGCLISSSGSGYTWDRNSRENKLTSWRNDPTTDMPSEAIYLFDIRHNDLWSPLQSIESPDRASTVNIEHRHGISTFKKKYGGVESSVSVFVDIVRPVKVYAIELKNTSDHPMQLRMTCILETVLGVNREGTRLHQVSRVHPELNCITMSNGFHAEYPGQRLFLKISDSPARYSGNRTQALGRNGSWSDPYSARNILDSIVGPCLDPCLASQVDFDLSPHDTRSIQILIGTIPEGLTLEETIQDLENHPVEIEQVQSHWAGMLSRIQVETPNSDFNYLVNQWLMYQTIVCRMWARTAFYQAGGAFGFRDQLQDSMAAVYVMPQEVRTHLLRAASRQYLDGSVQHWWHPPSGKGTKTRFSDDFLFLPFTVAHYIEVTGDSQILEEKVGYVESHELEPSEHERYEEPAISNTVESLLEHCFRSLQHGMKYGIHGLPLIGCGDWNDGFNRIGAEGKGESVWVAWFQIVVFRQFAQMLRRIYPDRLHQAEELEKRAMEIRQAIESTAWDGDWYVRAFFDDGSAVGTRSNAECQIDSLAQSWAVIVDPSSERAKKGFQSAMKLLYDRKNNLVKLFTPPFENDPRDPGYIQGYVPGVRENGGQYTHAAMWMVQAATQLGDGENAMALFDSLNPLKLSAIAGDRYKLEPYVVAADVYSNPNHYGRGGWSWYTGSSAWMYRVALENILGVEVSENRLTFRPVVPTDWSGFSVRWKYGASLWRIRVEFVNSESPDLEQYASVELFDDGQEHQVTLYITGENRRISQPMILDTMEQLAQFRAEQ